MSRFKQAALAVCLIGVPASGCSLTDPAPRDFTLADQRSAKAEEAGNTLKEAEAACKAGKTTEAASKANAALGLLK